MPERTAAKPPARRVRRRMRRVTGEFVHRLSPPDTQNARFDGARGYLVVHQGLFGPSMGLTPSRCALRGQPAAVQFCSRRICRSRRQDAGANSGKAVGPKGEAQDAPSHRRVRPPPLSARYAKRPFDGASDCVVVREGLFGPSMGQTPTRCALRGQPAAVQIRSRRICRTVGPSTTSLRQIRKTPRSGRFAYLAEREGFEPSIRLLTRYSLSRGAPSATRASLRGFAA